MKSEQDVNQNEVEDGRERTFPGNDSASMHCKLRRFPVMLLSLECRFPVKPVPAAFQGKSLRL